mmetsp:Transcript_34504/g.64371  ORF Transcript_34504/g.64371 Transcript_34504/m.64371 type:complete len:84 (-) Transcript_34504:3726-3977(-)
MKKKNCHMAHPVLTVVRLPAYTAALPLSPRWLLQGCMAITPQSVPHHFLSVSAPAVAAQKKRDPVDPPKSQLGNICLFVCQRM